MQIELQEVSKRYGAEWIFVAIDLKIFPKDRWAFLGANGSGKSTLLQVISGHIRPSRGKVIVTHEDKIIETDQLFHQIGYSAPSLFLPELFSIREFLEFHFKHKSNYLSVDETLAYIGLAKDAHKYIEQCSSGMRQRVKLAQAIMVNTPLLLLDEPTGNLDKAGIQLYQKMVADFAADKTIIVSSNDEQEYEFCTQVLNIADHKLEENI
jgi:ABC-2 type transport system ATP-binding protein